MREASPRPLLHALLAIATITAVTSRTHAQEATANDDNAKDDNAMTLPSPRLPEAGPVQPWVRLGTFGEYHGDNHDGFDNNDRFYALVTRANAGMRAPVGELDLRVAARLDSQHLRQTDGELCDANADGTLSDTERSSCPYGDDLRLQRVTVEARYRGVRATLGDYNVNFGRGLGLTVRKIDEIGIDATLKGARLDARGGPLRATALVGLANQQNSDFATRKRIADPGYRALRCVETDADTDGHDRAGSRLWTTCSDFVAGGRLQAQLPARITTGAHYSYIAFGESSSAALSEVLHVAGGDVARTRILDRWDAFLGASVLLRNPQLGGLDAETSRYEGLALYSVNNLDFDATTAVVELKHYQDYLVAQTPQTLQYAEPPTLEREDQEVPGAFNATGGRARVDHLFRDAGVTVYGNLTAYGFTETLQRHVLDHDGDCEPIGGARCPQVAAAVHPYAGVIVRRDRFELEASGGYRHEAFLRELGPGDGTLRRRFPHGELYLTLPLGKAGGMTHSTSVRTEARLETKQVRGFDDLRFAKGSVVLGYAMAPLLSLALIGGFSTEFPALTDEPELQHQRCEAEGGIELCLRKPQLWPGVEARFNFMSSSFLRVFAGRQVGGRVCVNGACRTLPDFEGVRSELVVAL